jgi:hypothetical protein
VPEVWPQLDRSALGVARRTVGDRRCQAKTGPPPLVISSSVVAGECRCTSLLPAVAVDKDHVEWPIYPQLEELSTDSVRAVCCLRAMA